MAHTANTSRDDSTQDRLTDIKQADAKRAFDRAYSEWEWFYGLAVNNPAMRADPVWQSLQAHLAQRTDSAFMEYEKIGGDV